MRNAAVLILVLFGGATANAHQDAIFQIDSNGVFQGFPDEYGPASLTLSAPSSSHPGIPEAAVVRIGSFEVQLPRCVRAMLAIPPSEKVRAHGSWYHDPSLLPPYLIFEFPQRRNDSGFFDGHALMFDMTNGSLLEIKHWQIDEGRGARGTPVDLSQACSESERRAFVPKRIAAPRTW